MRLEVLVSWFGIIANRSPLLVSSDHERPRETTVICAMMPRPKRGCPKMERMKPSGNVEVRCNNHGCSGAPMAWTPLRSRGCGSKGDKTPPKIHPRWIMGEFGETFGSGRLLGCGGFTTLRTNAMLLASTKMLRSDR